MMANWSVFALWWYGGPGAVPAGVADGRATDPIFGRSIAFYLFTLPAWELVVGWLMTLAVLTWALAVFFVLVGSGLRRGRPGARAAPALRGVALTWAAVLLVFAARTYIGRFDRLFADHTIFTGVTYTEAHVTLTGMLIVAGLLALGAARRRGQRVRRPAHPLADRRPTACGSRVPRDRRRWRVHEHLHRQAE